MLRTAAILFNAERRMTATADSLHDYNSCVLVLDCVCSRLVALLLRSCSYRKLKELDWVAMQRMWLLCRQRVTEQRNGDDPRVPEVASERLADILK